MTKIAVEQVVVEQVAVECAAAEWVAVGTKAQRLVLVLAEQARIHECARSPVRELACWSFGW